MATTYYIGKWKVGEKNLCIQCTTQNVFISWNGEVTNIFK